MKKFFTCCLGVAALLASNFVVSEVRADGLFSKFSVDRSCSEISCEPTCAKPSLWEFGGWVETGIYGNRYGQRNSYESGREHNLVLRSGNTAVSPNVQQTDLQVNQAWVFLGKKLDARTFDVGGRVDFLYGTDAKFTQSQGLEYRANRDRTWGEGDYYGSLAQVYGEVGYKEFSVKLGKFLSPIGHESIMAPERFFYSLSYQFAAQPHTHTGALATWNPNRNLSIFGGWVCGENRNRESLTFYNGDNNAALFGVNYRFNDKFNVGYAAMAGREWDYYGFGQRHNDYFVQSLVLNWKPTCRWDYTFEWTLRNGVDKNRWNDGTYVHEHKIGTFGINQELIYRFNCCWAMGARFEWMRTYDSNYENGALSSGNVNDLYEFTLGLNWTPKPWLLVRPEIRYDKVFNPNDAPFNNIKGGGLDNRNDQLSGGVSAVVKF